jgi:hypothetical protein
MMNIAKNRIRKVFSEIITEKEGITVFELGAKLDKKYSDSLSFANFDDFIRLNIIVGRLEQKDEKIYITERGKKALQV